jgi:hypothetical protein
MFVLIGKVTSLAETFKGFPASDPDAFKEQMKELGQDGGTFIRVIFNYQKKDEDEQPYVKPVVDPVQIPDPKPAEKPEEKPHEEPKHEDPKPDPKPETKPEEKPTKPDDKPPKKDPLDDLIHDNEDEPKHEDPKPVDPKPVEPKVPDCLILEANYGGKDQRWFIGDMYSKGKRDFNADNNVYGDTLPGQIKWLYVKWTDHGETKDKTVWEDKSWDKIWLPDGNCTVKW